MHAFYFSSVMLDLPCITGKHTLICFFCMRSHRHIYQQHRLCAYAVNNWYDTVWYSYRIIYGAVNNNFLSRVGWFANDFHEWRSHEWISLVSHHTSDQKIVIHGNPYVISFLACSDLVYNTGKWWKLSMTHCLFAMDLFIAVLWRHMSMHCDIILPDCPQNASKGARAFSCHRQVHYH